MKLGKTKKGTLHFLGENGLIRCDKNITVEVSLFNCIPLDVTCKKCRGYKVYKDAVKMQNSKDTAKKPSGIAEKPKLKASVPVAKPTAKKKPVKPKVEKKKAVKRPTPTPPHGKTFKHPAESVDHTEKKGFDPQSKAKELELAGFGIAKKLTLLEKKVNSALNVTERYAYLLALKDKILEQKLLENLPAITKENFRKEDLVYFSAVDSRGHRLLSIKSLNIDAAKLLLEAKFIKRGWKSKRYYNLYLRWYRGGYAIVMGVPEKMSKEEEKRIATIGSPGKPKKMIKRRPPAGKVIKRRVKKSKTTIRRRKK